jgi:hypothetical protein
MSERDVQGKSQCPRCAAPVDEAATTCWTCGQPVVPSEATHQEIQFGATHQEIPSDATHQEIPFEEPDQIPLVEWKSADDHAPLPDDDALNVQARGSVPVGGAKLGSLALIGGGSVVVCVMALIVIQSLRPAASPQPIATPRSTPAPVAAAPVVESAPAPTWDGNRQATWANDGSRTISFELKATHDVNVWMSRVRPVLVVRCLYRTTEVFVATKSAASIEGQSGSHTVRLQIDDDAELVQQWTDSVSSQELFAPNSVALARRLASAERLRFSFTPYNASPVNAEFSVQGFDKLAALVGNTCGWKLDESRSPQARTARLK